MNRLDFGAETTMLCGVTCVKVSNSIVNIKQRKKIVRTYKRRKNATAYGKTTLSRTDFLTDFTTISWDTTPEKVSSPVRNSNQNKIKWKQKINASTTGFKEDQPSLVKTNTKKKKKKKTISCDATPEKVSNPVRNSSLHKIKKKSKYHQLSLVKKKKNGYKKEKKKKTVIFQRCR